MFLLLFLPFLFGCNMTNEKDKNRSETSTTETELMTEIESNDSVAHEMKDVKDEIEESSEKLDELLEDL